MPAYPKRTVEPVYYTTGANGKTQYVRQNFNIVTLELQAGVQRTFVEPAERAVRGDETTVNQDPASNIRIYDGNAYPGTQFGQ
jgi:hypothetical protein